MADHIEHGLRAAAGTDRLHLVEHSMGDVDPELAARTRERLWRELADGRTIGVGAHFPELRPGRVASLPERRWDHIG